MRAERDQKMGSDLFDTRQSAAETDERISSCFPKRPDAQACEQLFSEVLTRKDVVDDDETPPMPTPFDLFAESKPVSASIAEVAASQSLTELVVGAVQHLYVSRDGAEKRQVSMDLAEDILPGVNLLVYEEIDRVIVDFVCANEDSHDALCDISERLVVEFANQISRASRVYVRTDDPDDLYIHQVDADPVTAAGDSSHDV